MRKSAPINLIVYYPTTEEGKKEFAERMGKVEAMAVMWRLQSLDCPSEQKLELIDKLIEITKKKNNEKKGTEP